MTGMMGWIVWPVLHVWHIGLVFGWPLLVMWAFSAPAESVSPLPRPADRVLSDSVRAVDWDAETLDWPE